MSGSCRTPKNEPAAQHNKIAHGDFHKTVRDALIPKEAREYIEQLQSCIDEIEAIACGEKQIQADGVYDDSDALKYIYDKIQSLRRNKQWK